MVHLQLEFLTILVEQSTSNTTLVAVTLNLGVICHNELKAQKPGGVSRTIESRVVMQMEWSSRE